MKARWLLVIPAAAVALIVRGVLVQLTVGARRAYWSSRRTGDGPLVVALGDSLTQGIGSSRPSTSWLALFAGQLEQRWATPVRIDNRSVYGAKLADLIEHQLPLPADAALVTMCIGSNDAGRTEPAEFAAMLRTVCAQLPPGSIVGDVPKFQKGPRVPKAAELSRIVRDVVAEFPQLILARVEQHTRDTRILTDLAGDYFHPNDSGYRHIAQAFIEASMQSTLTV
jgi:lysophospholipase L1-like esterase